MAMCNQLIPLHSKGLSRDRIAQSDSTQLPSGAVVTQLASSQLSSAVSGRAM